MALICSCTFVQLQLVLLKLLLICRCSCATTTLNFVSSEPCVEPVTTKNGHVYERRLIEKHISITGVDPVTKEPLSTSDLIPLKVTPSPASMRPKTAAQQGIPAMLQGFQAEWDALMLEVFTLKQQLSVAQQQLSQALYQQDAACRVIARLMKERDLYKSQLSQARVAGASGENGMDVDSVPSSSAPVLPESITKRVEVKAANLSEARGSRQVGPQVATRDKVSAYVAASNNLPHKSGNILCLDVVDALVVTGGTDKTVVVMNQTSGKKVSTLNGHKQSVIALRAVPYGASGARIVSVDEDSVLNVWDTSDVTDGAAFALSTTISLKTPGATSIDVHPIGDLALVGFKDGSFAQVDLSTQETYTHQHAKLLDSPLTAVQYHPDGEILATAAESGRIHIWNVLTHAHMANFSGHTGSVTSLQFSENGYSLASVATDQTLKVWDLLPDGETKTLQLGTGTSPYALSYDYSGRFLAVALATTSGTSSAKEIRVFTGRSLALAATFELGNSNKDISALHWGPNASWLVFAQDRHIHYWTSS